MEIIKTINLTKKFIVDKNEITILKDINFEVSKGEFLSIMGSSGSGKSTLLYLLGGLDKPTSGNIIVKGKNIEQLNNEEISKIRRKTIGFIFQFYNLMPNLNIEENVLLPIILNGGNTKEYKSKVKEVLENVGLGDKAKHLPSELSGGQQQRVSIARALINDPDIILADELTGNLDSNTGNEIIKLLRKMNIERNKTIIQVTHSNEMAKLSDKIMIMKDGQIS